MRDFENRDVVRILGVNPSTLIDWCESGLVAPAVSAEGPGSRRRYSEKNLVLLAICKALLEDGLRRDIVMAVARNLNDAAHDRRLSLQHQGEPQTLFIDLVERQAIWVQPDEFLQSLLSPRRVYFLNVAKLKSEIQRQLGGQN